MSSIIGAIVMVTNILQNLTQNPLRILFGPYIALLGDFFYGFIGLGVAAIIYVNTEGNTRTVGVLGWLISFLGIFAVVLNIGFTMFLGVAVAMLIGIIIYKGYIAKEEY